MISFIIFTVCWNQDQNKACALPLVAISQISFIPWNVVIEETHSFSQSGFCLLYLDGVSYHVPLTPAFPENQWVYLGLMVACLFGGRRQGEALCLVVSFLRSHWSSLPRHIHSLQVSKWLYFNSFIPSSFIS